MSSFSSMSVIQTKVMHIPQSSTKRKFLHAFLYILIDVRLRYLNLNLLLNTEGNLNSKLVFL